MVLMRRMFAPSAADLHGRSSAGWQLQLSAVVLASPWPDLSTLARVLLLPALAVLQLTRWLRELDEAVASSLALALVRADGHGELLPDLL